MITLLVLVGLVALTYTMRYLSRQFIRQDRYVKLKAREQSALQERTRQLELANSEADQEEQRLAMEALAREKAKLDVHCHDVAEHDQRVAEAEKAAIFCNSCGFEIEKDDLEFARRQRLIDGEVVYICDDCINDA